MSTQCSNCYNGCLEITSDRCVKYTGVNVPVLGIQNGDSLSFVEQALITFLTATLDGSGITITIDENDYCELVSQYLQECSTVTALDLFKALVKAACDLQEQVDSVEEDIATIEANYTISCLSGVSAGDGTHAIVQAIITKLCAIDTSLTALALNVATNYVKIADINSYIAAYIASTTVSYSSRMVPYCPIPYMGSLTNFDVSGAGSGQYADIYLCNGLNGTPDLRGRIIVGSIVGVGGGALDPTVDPGSSSFNPNYAVGDVDGANSITLTLNQIPAHPHPISDAGHAHKLAVVDTSMVPLTTSNQHLVTHGAGLGIEDYDLTAGTATPSYVPNAGISGNTVTGITVNNACGGAAHSNLQPVFSTYFIIYLP